MKKIIAGVMLLLITLVSCDTTKTPEMGLIKTETEETTNATTETNTEAETIIGEENAPELLASIQNENLYLYGLRPQGYVLYNNGYATYFDWYRGSFDNQMVLEDFDDDGKKELAITTCYKMGTGVHIEDLNVLKITEKDDEYQYKVYTTDEEDFEMQLNEAMNYHINGKEVNLTVNYETHTFDLSDEIEADHVVKGVQLTNVVKYSFVNDAIKVEFDICFLTEETFNNIYLGSVKADVNFNNGLFILSNYEIVS